jgi:hypothetical protein
MRILKSRLFLYNCIIIFILFPSAGHAQTLTAVPFLNSVTIQVLCHGIDFTKAKLINDDYSKAEIIQKGSSME